MLACLRPVATGVALTAGVVHPHALCACAHPSFLPFICAHSVVLVFTCLCVHSYSFVLVWAHLSASNTQLVHTS